MVQASRSEEIDLVEPSNLPHAHNCDACHSLLKAHHCTASYYDNSLEYILVTASEPSLGTKPRGFIQIKLSPEAAIETPIKP
jgi:hypothetical protein